MLPIRFAVAPSPSGWKLQRDLRLVSIHATRQQAIKMADLLAQKDATRGRESEISIHNGDGSVMRWVRGEGS